LLPIFNRLALLTGGLLFENIPLLLSPANSAIFVTVYCWRLLNGISPPPYTFLIIKAEDLLTPAKSDDF